MGIFNKYNRWFSYLFIYLRGGLCASEEAVSLNPVTETRFLLIPNISGLAFRFLHLRPQNLTVKNCFLWGLNMNKCAQMNSHTYLGIYT